MESFELPAIEELLGERLDCIRPDPALLELPDPVRKPRPRKPSKSSRRVSPPLTPPYVPFMAYGGFR